MQQKNLNLNLNLSQPKAGTTLQLYSGKKSVKERLKQNIKEYGYGSLRDLGLHQRVIVDGDFVGMLVEGCWGSLERVTFNRFGISPENAKELFTKLQLPILKSLHYESSDLQNQQISLASLAQNPNIPKHALEQLQIHRIENKGLEYLVGLPFGSLRCLDLGDSWIRGAGVRLLVKIYMPCIEGLSLESCQLYNQGPKQLTKSHWPQLTSLNLKNNKISLQGHQAITLNNWHTQKTVIDLAENERDPCAILDLVAGQLGMGVQYSVWFSGVNRFYLFFGVSELLYRSRENYR